MDIVIVGLLLGGTYASMAVRFRVRLAVEARTPRLPGAHVTFGVGGWQRQGSPIEKIKPCVVVWFPPARSTAPRTAPGPDESRR